MEKQKFTEIEKMAEIVKGYCDVCPVKDKEQETCLLCKMEHLYNHNYRQVNQNLEICTCYDFCQQIKKTKQTTAKEIIDLANETIKNISEIVGTDVEVFSKAGIRLIQTKIMERYGV